MVGVINIPEWVCQFVFGIGRVATIGILGRFQRRYYQYYYGDISGVHVVGILDGKFQEN